MRHILPAALFSLAMVMPVLAQPIPVPTRSAWVDFDEQTGQPAIKISLSPEGKEVFSAFTAEHVGKRIDVLVNGEVVTSPTIHTPIHSEWIIVTGPFSGSEMEAIAEAIKNNSDPVTLRPAKIKSGT